MLSAEVAFAAGLFEGEGSVIVPDVSGAARMTMCSTDREPLERLIAVWGGRLYGPYRHGGRTNKPIYQWQVSGWDTVAQVYADIGALLSPRRRSQFETVLDHPRRHSVKGVQSRGVKNNHNKLTEADVYAIRAMGTSMTQRELGRHFGVSHTSIGYILRRYTWKHLA